MLSEILIEKHKNLQQNSYPHLLDTLKDTPLPDNVKKNKNVLSLIMQSSKK
jgi:hypothetical protein